MAAIGDITGWHLSSLVVLGGGLGGNPGGGPGDGNFRLFYCPRWLSCDLTVKRKQNPSIGIFQSRYECLFF